MKFLRALAMLSLAMIVCSTQPVQAPKQTHTRQMPAIIIRSIKNNTRYDFLLLDRFNKKTALKILSGQTVDTSLITNNKNNIVLRGSMVDIMAKKAQYIFKRIDENGESVPHEEVYLNIHASAGGVDDGSGIISGTPGSVILKFFMAGSKGGCIMTSERLQNAQCKVGEFSLELGSDEDADRENVFRIQVGGTLIEK